MDSGSPRHEDPLPCEDVKANTVLFMPDLGHVCREWIQRTIPEGEWDQNRQAFYRGQLTGSRRFVDEVAEGIQRRIETRGQERPKQNQK